MSNHHDLKEEIRKERVMSREADIEEVTENTEQKAYFEKTFHLSNYERFLVWEDAGHVRS